MGNIVRTSQSSHWYTQDGAPCYEVPNASKPGEMRGTTIADARKLGLVPSVTTVMSIIEKRALTAWKIEQAILAGMSLERLDGEPAITYARRVAEEGASVSGKAADFGTRLHEAIAEIVTDGCASLDEDLHPFVDSFHNWWRRNQDSLRGSVTDFKTQGVEHPAKFRHYPEWCQQLAAYGKGAVECFPGFNLHDGGVCEVPFASRLGFGGRVDLIWPPFKPRTWPKLINVIISSKTPGYIEVKEWTLAEARQGWREFKAIHRAWCVLKRYDPKLKAKETDDAVK